MRILWHSAAPWVNTGYGRVTREVAARLQNTHHEMGLQSIAAVRRGPVKWYGDVWDGEENEFVEPVEIDEPIPVYPSTGQAGGGRGSHFGTREVKESFQAFDADFYFTHFDTWMNVPRQVIPQLEISYGSYVIIDHYPAPEVAIEQVNNATEVVAMSQYAKEALGERGIRSTYIPHGVNTRKYYPIPEDSSEYHHQIRKVRDIDEQEDIVDLDERFVFGMVAANHADRKHIPEHMQAFKHFVDRVDEDALLYLHTDQNSPQGFDLRRVQREIGLSDDNVLWASANLYHDIGDHTLNSFYNMLDVMLNCTRGESWGLTITEAQASGTPCILTNFSSMPEQVGADPSHPNWHAWMGEGPKRPGENVRQAPHGILVDPVVGIVREHTSSKQFLCHPEDIYEAMTIYYNNRDLLAEHADMCRQHVKDHYDWENDVLPRFKSMFDRVEEELPQ